jgi:hypothetical protein
MPRAPRPASVSEYIVSEHIERVCRSRIVEKNSVANTVKHGIGARTNGLHSRIRAPLERFGSEVKPSRRVGDAVYALSDVEEGVQDEEGEGGTRHEGCPHHEHGV